MYVSGRSVRYANPVVENTSFKCEANFDKSSGLGDGEDRAARETMGRDENEVDILKI